MSVREEKREATRARIEAAGLRLFSDAGFEATPVAGIATAAGVSRSTFFRYFASKDDVLFANHVRDAELLRSLARDAAAERGDLTDGALVASVVLRFAEHLEASADALAVRARVVAGDPRLLGRAMTARSEWEQLLAAELAAAQGDEDPSLAMRVTAAAAVGALHMAVRAWRLGSGRDGLVPLVREALAHLPARA